MHVLITLCEDTLLSRRNVSTSAVFETETPAFFQVYELVVAYFARFFNCTSHLLPLLPRETVV